MRDPLVNLEPHIFVGEQQWLNDEQYNDINLKKNLTKVQP